MVVVVVAVVGQMTSDQHQVGCRGRHGVVGTT
jgi:hypothetical protein